MTVIEHHWLAYWDAPTGGPAISPVVLTAGFQAKEYADAGYRVEAFVTRDAASVAVVDRRIISHALTLALKDRVSDVSEAKDALIKRAATDLGLDGWQ